MHGKHIQKEYSALPSLVNQFRGSSIPSEISKNVLLMRGDECLFFLWSSAAVWVMEEKLLP